MHSSQNRKDAAGKGYLKYVLIVLTTAAVSSAFTLAVMLYPIDQAELSEVGGAVMRETTPTAVPETAAERAVAPPIETAADDRLTRDVVGLEAETVVERSVEWTEDAGSWIAFDVISVAKDKSVSDTAVRGELRRCVEKTCLQRGGCSEKELDALSLSAEKAIGAYIMDAKGDFEEKTEWHGRLLLTHDRDAAALEHFDNANLTAHVRTLLVDLMNESSNDCRTETDVFASTMAEYGHTGMYMWSPRLELLMSRMTPSEAADTKYVLCRYVSCLRRRQVTEETGDALDGIIYDLERLGSAPSP